MNGSIQSCQEAASEAAPAAKGRAKESRARPPELAMGAPVFRVEERDQRAVLSDARTIEPPPSGAAQEAVEARRASFPAVPPA